MAKQAPLFHRPGFASLRQAIDWVALSGAFALLFNVLHTSGIELKVRPSYQKAASAHLSNTTDNASYAGWNNADGTASKPKGKRAAYTVEKLPTTLGEWQAKFPHLSLVGAQVAYADKNITFIDTRKPEDYAEGHIAGALNFYADEYEDFAPQVMPLLSPEKTYILYCNGTSCDLSHHLAVRLSEQGYKNLKVFFNGWSLWRKAGLPIHQGVRP